MKTQKRILVIGTDPGLEQLLKSCLEDRYYEITTVIDNGDALQATIAELLPDLVIVDPVMPGLHQGVELCLRIRRWSPVPILVLHSTGDTVNKVKEIAQDSEGYLTATFGAVADVRGCLDNVFSLN